MISRFMSRPAHVQEVLESTPLGAEVVRHRTLNSVIYLGLKSAGNHLCSRIVPEWECFPHDSVNIWY